MAGTFVIGAGPGGTVGPYQSFGPSMTAAFGQGMTQCSGNMMGARMAGLTGGAAGSLVGSSLGGVGGGVAGGLLGGVLGGAVGSQFSQQAQSPSYSNGMPSYLGSQNFGGSCPMSKQQAPNQNNFEWAATHQTFPPAPPPPQKNGGTVTQDGPGKPINYTSPGGYKVNVDGSTVTITAPDGKSQVQQWGDPHERTSSTGQADSGDTTKNWSASNETIMLPDGTRVTMQAPQANQPISSTSIYNGGEDIQINNGDNTVTSQGYNVQQSLKDQKNQQMGDTQYFGPSQKGGGGNYELMDLFTQENNQITQNRKLLATLGAVSQTSDSGN